MHGTTLSRKKEPPPQAIARNTLGKGSCHPTLAFCSVQERDYHTHTSQRLLPTFAKGRLFCFGFGFGLEHFPKQNKLLSPPSSSGISPAWEMETPSASDNWQGYHFSSLRPGKGCPPQPSIQEPQQTRRERLLQRPDSFVRGLLCTRAGEGKGTSP